jgi:hypothetical protein
MMGVLVRAESRTADDGTTMLIVTKATVDRLAEEGFPVAHPLVPLIPRLNRRGDGTDPMLNLKDMIVLFLRSE